MTCECGEPLGNDGRCASQCDDCQRHAGVLHIHAVRNIDGRSVTIVAEGERVCRECYVKRGGRRLPDIERERS